MNGKKLINENLRRQWHNMEGMRSSWITYGMENKQLPERDQS